MCSTAIAAETLMQASGEHGLPDAHGPSMATNAHRLGQQPFHTINRGFHAFDGSSMSLLIRFAALQAPRSHHSNGLLEYGQTVGARADAQPRHTPACSPCRVAMRSVTEAPSGAT